MELRKLGQTDLEVTRISMGTMSFGNQVSESDAIRMVDRCLDYGINFFDTANTYNTGQTEAILGKALSGRRHKVVLATKVGGRMGDESDDEGLSRPAIRKAIDASLKRLGTDYVDLYYLLQPDSNVEIDETLATMDELVTEGKVRYPATSNYAAWQITEMLWHCENRGFLGPTVSQTIYNLLARGIEQEYLSCCRRFHIAVIAYNPLVRGLLTGKYSPGYPPLSGTGFDGDKGCQGQCWNQNYFDAAGKIREISDRAGMSMIDLAFRWMLAQSQVDSVILSAASMEQLEENVAACQRPPLSDEVLKECDGLWQEVRGITPQYDR